MTSVLNVDTIAAKDGTSPVGLTKQEAAKAYVLFNGTGTVATRKAFNCSSITDLDTGSYTANWTNSFDGASNYVGLVLVLGLMRQVQARQEMFLLMELQGLLLLLCLYLQETQQEQGWIVTTFIQQHMETSHNGKHT